MKNQASDILIVGAGPAGATASMWLSKHQVPHTIIDKAIFPRDKVCGDALSGKVYSILKQIEPDIWKQFGELPNEFLGTQGVCFSSPKGHEIVLSFTGENKELTSYDDLRNIAPGFVSKRIDFDNFLVQKLNPEYATIHQGATLKKLFRSEANQTEAVIKTYDKEELVLNPKIVIGADGERSVVNKSLAKHRNKDKHFAVAVRGYYEGVTGFKEGNLIELHYIKEAIPGYLWIFPLPNGACNVGMGMLSSHAKKGKRNLRKEMVEILNNHPRFKDRFKNAKLQDNIVGWGLPLGSKKRSISGDGYILTGDAASLIDPLTGEGIGNAIISGKYAGVYAMEALQANDYSADFLYRYDKMIYKKLWEELRASRLIQQVATQGWLVDFLFAKVSNSPGLKSLLSMLFVDVSEREILWNPLFYLRILFGLEGKK